MQGFRKTNYTHIDLYDNDDVLFENTEHTTATLSTLPKKLFLAFLGFFIYISYRKWQKVTVLYYIFYLAVQVWRKKHIKQKNWKLMHM